MHTKSIVDGEPVMLPNGRIYGRERLEVLNERGEGKGRSEEKTGQVRDPVTGEMFAWEKVRKAYIL